MNRPNNIAGAEDAEGEREKGWMGGREEGWKMGRVEEEKGGWVATYFVRITANAAVT